MTDLTIVLKNSLSPMFRLIYVFLIAQCILQLVNFSIFLPFVVYLTVLYKNKLFIFR